MTFKHCEPAAKIIRRFGGTTVVCKIVGKNESSIRRWRLKQPTGSGGVIPDRAKLQLIAAAPKYGIKLTFADFEPKDRVAVMNRRK